MERGIAHNGDVRIAYEDFGKPGGRPLLLISGLDDQMISSWPDGFCEALAGAGLHAVRYDHRDAGLSTHFTGKKKAYELTDMIDDMMAVLDAMGWESANLAGLSMGGGLAQFAALWHPDRVRTLTVISSIPPHGQPSTRNGALPAFLPGTVQAGVPPLRRQPGGQAADDDGHHPADRGQEPAAGRRMGPPDSGGISCAATPQTGTPGPASSPRATPRSCPTAGSPASPSRSW